MGPPEKNKATENSRDANAEKNKKNDQVKKNMKANNEQNTNVKQSTKEKNYDVEAGGSLSCRKSALNM